MPWQHNADTQTRFGLLSGCMHQFASTPAPVTQPVIHQFKRRECIPLRGKHPLAFPVRSRPLADPVRRGYCHYPGVLECGRCNWGAAHRYSPPASLECLMDVEAVRLHYQQCRELPQVTMAHLHQMQALNSHAAGQYSSAVRTAAYLAGAEVWLPYRGRATDSTAVNPPGTG